MPHLFYRYRIVFVHYGLSVAILFLIRPWVNKVFQNKGHCASRPIYAALYLFPILCLIHGIMAGLICKYIRLFWYSHISNDSECFIFHLDYAFPSIIILLSLMSPAYHFASRTDQVGFYRFAFTPFLYRSFLFPLNKSLLYFSRGGPCYTIRCRVSTIWR